MKYTIIGADNTTHTEMTIKGGQTCHCYNSIIEEISGTTRAQAMKAYQLLHPTCRIIKVTAEPYLLLPGKRFDERMAVTA